MIITLRIFYQLSRERFINLLDYSFDLLLWFIYRPSQPGESEVQLCDAETIDKTLQVNTGIREYGGKLLNFLSSEV